MILGIDPAKDGSAVLLDDRGQVEQVWSWKTCQRNKEEWYKLTHSKSGSKVGWEHILKPQGIAHMMTFSITDLDGIACEEAYVDSRNPKSGLRVAKFGGIVAGGIAKTHMRTKEIEWVMATGWRANLLGLRVNTPREQCKRASLQMMPKINPSINHHLAIHGQLDHITDALGVATWLARKM